MSSSLAAFFGQAPGIAGHPGTFAENYMMGWNPLAGNYTTDPDVNSKIKNVDWIGQYWASPAGQSLIGVPQQIMNFTEPTPGSVLAGFPGVLGMGVGGMGGIGNGALSFGVGGAGLNFFA